MMKKMPVPALLPAALFIALLLGGCATSPDAAQTPATLNKAKEAQAARELRSDVTDIRHRIQDRRDIIKSRTAGS